MYKHILVPLDGSALAEEALPDAVLLAESFQGELTLLKVLVPFPDDKLRSRIGLNAAIETTTFLILGYLEDVAVCIRKHGVPVQVATIKGRPHEGIVQYVEANNVDLIVMCTRGYSGLKRWLFGRVADRVAGNTSVPVLLVRTKGEKIFNDSVPRGSYQNCLDLSLIRKLRIS
jgi:nucleotide-binding universal stress UspA family protein